MANIGLRYAVFSRVQSHTEGNAITYGTGREVGMMISATSLLRATAANFTQRCRCRRRQLHQRSADYD